MRQLVDIALRALSPAVNDPYTAIQAIHRLTVLLCALGPLPLGDYQITGKGFRGPNPSQPIRTWGAGDVEVIPAIALRAPPSRLESAVAISL